MSDKNMSEGSLKVFPPIYLIGKKISCWKCGSNMPVVALLSPKVEEMDDEVCVFTDIDTLPNEVLEHLKKRVPSFKLTYSKTVDRKYYANTCPQCGMLSGDFFLHSEPGGPFFPMDEEEAGLLYMTEIPIKSPVYIEAGYHIGPGNLIINHAQRIA